MKKKKFLLLPLLLLITSILVASVGCYLKYQVLAPLGLCQDESIFAVPFVLLADESVQFSLQYAQEQIAEPEAEEPSERNTQPQTEPATELATEPVTEPIPEPSDEQTEEPPLVLDSSWYDDALFIGNSQTVGLRNYADMGEADFYCDVGMSVFATNNVELQAKLERGSYGKIFINLGLNEIMGPRDIFLSKYQELLDQIRSKQPDAVIFIQEIMTVGREKAASSENFSLENIAKLNEELAAMADGEKIIFFEVNEWAADEEGYLHDEISEDGVHLNGQENAEFSEWILEKVASYGIK